MILNQFTMPAPMPQQAATAKILNTAEPTMVPTPISPSVMKVPITFTKSSGADVAAAINVAPATSLDILRAASSIRKIYKNLFAFYSLLLVNYLPAHIFSTAGTKYSSHTTAKATNKYKLAIT